MRVLGLILGAVGVAGAALAHLSHREADRARYDRRAEARTLYQPQGDALRVAAMGYHGLLADGMWVRAVLQFADLMEDGSEQSTRWLESTLQAIAVLDPQWRTVYYYGGGFLRVMEDVEASDRLFELGMQNLPDEPYFPFSLGMNAYLHRDDTEAAQRWLSIAAEKPSAPPWYHAAAASFLEGRGQRRAAIRYVQEQIEQESRPDVVRSLERKRDALMHDELSGRLTELVERWEAEQGQPAPELSVLGALPPDPLGGAWMRSSDGVVRSTVRDALMDRRARIDERQLLLKRPNQRGFPESSGL